MGLSYRTEYHFGRRGARICRSYTGLRAVLAIAIDLFFVLTFELGLGLVLLVLRNLIRVLSLLFELAIHLLVLPFRIARRIDACLSRYVESRRSRRAARGFASKPAWSGLDEI
jgi:hypothetical protein